MFRETAFFALVLTATASGYATTPASAGLTSPQPGHFGLTRPNPSTPNKAGHTAMGGHTDYPMPGHHKKPL